MKKLFVEWHKGLGDTIICNGLIRTLAERRDVVVPCYSKNLPSVRHMFSDLENVSVVQLAADWFESFSTDEEPCDILRIGLKNPAFASIQPFDKSFYALAGVPFENRWTKFFVPPSETERVPAAEPHILIHDGGSSGDSGISDQNLWKATQTRRRCELIRIAPDPLHPLITDWRQMIRHAVEIHCIDSSFMHLVESVDTDAKLFYHRYARPKAAGEETDSIRRKPWTVIR